MQETILQVHNDQHFWLSHFRCMYWEQQKMLIMADLHLGKLGHFRKNGFALPQGESRDLAVLDQAIFMFKPNSLLIIGDMFHSKLNQEIQQFSVWRKKYPLLEIVLIKGNHDVLPQKWYQQNGIELKEDLWQIGDYTFIHDLGLEQNNNFTKEESAIFGLKSSSKKIFSNNFLHDTNTYFFTGHLHPGVHLKGRSKEGVTLPCFYFGPQVAVLPAFSHLAGVSVIKSKKNARIYAVLQEGLMEI